MAPFAPSSAKSCRSPKPPAPTKKSWSPAPPEKSSSFLKRGDEIFARIVSPPPVCDGRQSAEFSTRFSGSGSVSDYRCQLNRSAQHLREVYSQESRSPKSFADVDLDAARSGPVGIACSRRGRFSSADIVAISGWCFRSFLAARGCADHRSRLSRSWLL